MGEASTPRLGDALDFLRLIWAVDHGLQRASKRMLATIGVTGPQRFVLRIVARFPGITAGQLAQLLHIHPSTLTGILKRLERQGLVRRRPDGRDARRSCLGITEKGRRLERGEGSTIEAAIAKLMHRTPRARLAGARDVLEGIAAALAG